MSLFNLSNRQRKRKLLTPDQMNARKVNNDHIRSERYKNLQNLSNVCAVVAIPVLYIAWCIAVALNDPSSLPDVFKLGVTTVAGYVIGKTNLLGDKASSDSD